MKSKVNTSGKRRTTNPLPGAQTSKRIAGKAARLPDRIKHAQAEMMSIEHKIMLLSAEVNFILPMIRGLLKDAKAVAMSAVRKKE